MTEKEIERRMRELVRSRRGLFYKFTSTANPGVPDRVVITPGGEVWFVELKTAAGRLSKIQKHKFTEMQKYGANVRVVYGWDEARSFVEEVLPDGI